MANTLRIKRRAVGGAAGAPSSLNNAELAYNEQDNILYYGFGTGGAGGTATSVIGIGGPGLFVNLTGDQNIGGIKTFTTSPLGPTPNNADNSTKLATTAFVKNQNYLTGNETITISGDVSGTGATSISLSLANVGTAGTYTKVTTDSKGRVSSGTTLSATDIPTLTSAKISDFDTQVRLSRLDQMALPTASLNINSQRISSVLDPVSPQDAATKNYVDLAVQGLDPKASVVAATTANITLSGAQTIDGVSVVAGDRVLVKDQTDPIENGIYIAAAGTWARSSDADTWAKLPSAYVFSEGGTVNADSGFLCTNDAGGTVGSNAITFVQFSGAGQIAAGAGLTKTGNIIDIVTASASRIVVNADSIDLATAGTAGTYKIVTTDAYGRVTSGSSPTTLSGFGIVDAQPLDATLTALAGVTTAADTLIYATAADTFTTASLTAFGRSLIAAANATAVNTLLGLGSIALQAASSVDITGGSITGLTTFDNNTIDCGTF